MQKFKSISVTTANEWLNNKEAIMIDVREPIEYKEVHIAGAHLVPINIIELNKLPTERLNKKIVVYRKMGKRGSMACEKLLSENPNLDIYNIDGGIVAWENAGFKVVK